MATLAAAAIPFLLPPVASAAITVGPGSQPGLAVDAAGTAYVAWSGPGNPQPLMFCRLPRGATACDPAAASAITAPGATIRRPFVVVSGTRVVVVQSRYGAGVPGGLAVLRFTSTDGGNSFGPYEVVGDIAMNEAVAGPGDVLTGVTNADSGGMQVQSVPLSGSAPTNPDGSSAMPQAVLSTDHPYNGSVGMRDAATPLAVFTSGSDDAQFSNYGGAGPLSWTAPVGIGLARHPKLAGGPSGLFMLATTDLNDVFVRRWNGSGFAPPVSLGTKDEPPGQHLFQDAAGRLHEVFARGDADGIHLIHAVSDDGAVWSMGTVETQSVATAGGIADLRVATAADHIGVAAWQAGATAAEIRVTGIGPDAKPQPLFSSSGVANRKGTKFVVKLKAKIVLPAGVSAAQGCRGTVTVTVRRGTKRIASRTVTVGANCAYRARFAIKARKVKQAKRLKVRHAFAGNNVLAAATRNASVRVKR